MMQDHADARDQDPEIKYLIEDLCHAYQEGLALWNDRVKDAVIGEDVGDAEKLRRSLERYEELGTAYMRYYRLAGKHFAWGDSKTQTLLAKYFNVLDKEVIRILRSASEDAIARIPSIPGSFRTYSVVDYIHLRKRSDDVHQLTLGALERLFNSIQSWAVPLHTLPPLASPPTSSNSTETEQETESFLGSIQTRIRAPFHRVRYEYDELPTSYSFRLVRISTSRPYVTVELETFHLSDPPPFQALSYTWGTGGQSSEIWCNKLLFKVSSNLKRGLQRLAKYGTWSRTPWFWIDQICINQSDMAERTQQVRLMRAIYQRAQNTVIWLGRDDGSAGPAMQLAMDIYRLSLEYDPGNVDRQPPLPVPEDKRWAALPQFLALPWFERCWIIQEVVVSNGDPVMLCDGHQCLWPRFQRAMIWLLDHAPRYRIDRLQLIASIANLSSTRALWELPALLDSTRPFQATDLRDKVYALLGLTGETEDPTHWPTALAPNYGRTLREVYTEVTVYCITKTTSLSVLSQVDHTPDTGNLTSTSRLSLRRSTSDTAEHEEYIEGFPSWVPRWDILPRPVAISAFETVHNAAGWNARREKHNNACKDLPASIDQYAPPDILRIEGICVGSVQSCLPTMLPDAVYSASPTTNTFSHSHPKLCKSILDFYSIVSGRLNHLSAEEVARTFFLVTTAGLTPSKEDARDESLDSFYAFLRAAALRSPEKEVEEGSIYSLRNALQSNLSISTLTPALSPHLSTDNLSSSQSWGPPRSSTSPSLSPGNRSSSNLSPRATNEPTADRYTDALTPCLHRRLFITGDGYLGLGPAGMMSGDKVVVLFGGRVPYVIRRVGEEEDLGEGWKLVGECYLDGFMRGEAVEGLKSAEKGGSEWFDLV